MRFKLTFVLLLANLAVFFLLWRLNQPAEIVARPAGAIPKDNFDIDHITVNDKVKNEVRELTRDPNNVWHLVKPVNWLANSDAVEDLNNHLEFLDEKTNFSLDDALKSGETLKTYGFDKPPLVITVQSGTRSAELDVGTLTPDGNSLYVRNPADGLVRVVAQELLGTLDMPLDALREKRLFTLEANAVQSLSISVAGTGAASATSFTRFVKDNDDEQWRLDTPFSAPADHERVGGAITELLSLPAESFVPVTDAGDLARYGLTAPFLKITLKGDTADSSQELWLGGVVPGVTDKEYYAKLADNPTVVVVKDNEVLATLLRAQDTLRERRFLNFAPEKVSTINVQFEDSGEVQMEKLEDGTWQIADKEKDKSSAPAYIAADKGVIKTLLDNLSHLSAMNFASDAPTNDDLQNQFNLRTPAWKIVLQGDKTFKAITLDIGQRSDPTPADPKTKPIIHYYAKIEGVDSVYEIDPEFIRQLSTDPLHYRDRTLEKLPDGAQIVSFKLTKLAGDDLTTGSEIYNFSLDPAKTTWDELLKKQPQMVRDNLPVVLDAIRQFKVDSYLEAKFEEHYQVSPTEGSSISIGPTPAPWHYRLDVVVQLPGAGGAAASTETLTFYFSDRFGSLRLGGTQAAPLPPAVFSLPIAMNGALGSIIKEVEQPAAAVQTLRELDQPINPAVAIPAPSASTATSPSSVTPIAPLDVAVPAPTTVPAASTSAPASP